MNTNSPISPRAFALLELSLAAAALAVVLCLLAVIGERDRKLSMCGESLANLRLMGVGHASYGNDFQGRVCTFSWQLGVVPDTPYDDLRELALNGTGADAAAAQAVHILRKRAGRDDLPPPYGWIPYVGFSHLLLADYLKSELPMRAAVSPGDRHLLLWSGDPAGFDNGVYQPSPADAADLMTRLWPYSSSYAIGPAFCAADSISFGLTLQSVAGRDLGRGGFSGPGWQLGHRLYDEVVFPSQKALLFETAQRFHGNRDWYFASREARYPVLTVDGATMVRATKACNLGFNPFVPNSAFPLTFAYTPHPWQPEAPLREINMTGFLNFTRAGMRGRDFDGVEIPSFP